MSIINISFDTKNKTVKVTQNGSVIENVRHISINTYEFDEDEVESNIEITTLTSDEDNGTRTVMTLVANENGDLAEKIDDKLLIRELISQQFSK